MKNRRSWQLPLDRFFTADHINRQTRQAIYVPLRLRACKCHVLLPHCSSNGSADCDAAGSSDNPPVGLSYADIPPVDINDDVKIGDNRRMGNGDSWQRYIATVCSKLFVSVRKFVL
jgi:hypothetical protein